MDAEYFLRTAYGVRNEDLLREACAMATVTDVTKGTLLANCGEPQTQIFFLMKGIFPGH